MSVSGEFDDLRAWLARASGETPQPPVDEWLFGRMAEMGSATKSAQLLWLLGGRLGQEGAGVTPEPLARFMAHVAGLFSPESVLDPVCGTGVLLHEVVVKTGAKTAHGVERNPRSAQVARKLLGDSASIFEGDVLKTPQVAATYDLVVADPPIGLRVATPNSGKSEEFAHTLIRWSIERLSAGGAALFVVSPRFLWGTGAQGLHKAVKTAGCEVRALIYLPGGTLRTTASSNYLLVLDREARSEVFVGQLPTDDEAQIRLLENLRDHRSDRQLELGRLCKLAEFKGFEALVARERLRQLVEGKPLERVQGRQLFDAFELIDTQGGHQALEHGPSSCYLRVVGNLQAALGPDELDRGLQRHAKGTLHVHVDLSVADPRYLVPWLNESTIGQATLDTVTIGAPAQRLDVDGFLAATFHLPELATQVDVIRGLTLLGERAAEIRSLRSRLWEPDAQANEVVERIEARSAGSRDADLQVWMDALPFPLASVLWRYLAGGEGEWPFRVLLHFFEATAAFLATILLSATKRSDELWAQLGPGLRDRMGKEHPPLEQASFGSWVQIFEYLSGKFSDALGKPQEADRIKTVLGTKDPRTLRMLTSKEVRTVLRAAVNLRNRWHGHGGADNEESAAEKELELLPLIQTLQSAFRQSWVGYQLVRPGPGDFDGSLYHYRAKSLMGARSDPFPVVDIAMLESLKSQHLYLVDAAANSGMKLMDFVQVLPSEQRQAQTCYIYSRRTGAGDKPFVLVSYHFAAESERKTADSELEDALRWLHEVY